MTEWIVSSVVLITVVALVRQLLKGKISLRLQYALWAIVLVRLLVPITFGESKISVLNVLDQAASVVEHQEPAEEPTVSDPGWEPIGGSPAPIPTTPVITPGATINPDPVVPEQPEPVVPIVPDPGMNSDPVTEPEPPAVDEPVGAPVVTAAQILTVLWLCGIAVVGLWFLFTNLRFWLRLRRSRRVLELDCPIPVYVTGAAETPCLFGLIRPAIYLTPEVAEDEVALRHVLAHELTHYHHWDHVWSVLRCVCLAVHWYNPLVWLAASLSRRDAELACDESTIRRIGEEERTAYGRTLIGLTCVHRSNLLHTATTMTGSKKSLKERIVLIAKKPKMAIYTLVAVILIAAIAVGCTFTGAKEKEWDTVQFTYEGLEGYLEGKVTLTQGNRLDIMIQNRTDEYFEIDRFWDLYQKDEDGQWTAIKVNPTAEWIDFPQEAMIQPGKEKGSSWNGFYIDLDGEELAEGAYRVKASAWWLIDPAGDTWRDWTKGEEFSLIIEFTVTKDGEVKLNGDADLTESMHIPEELLPGEEDDPALNVDDLQLLFKDDLIALYGTVGKLDEVVLQYRGITQKLDGFIFNDMSPGCTTWENDADGDGILELYIVHEEGSGSGVSVMSLTVCEPDGGKLNVWRHDSTDIQNEFNNNRTAAYDAEANTVTVTYGIYTHVLALGDGYDYMPKVTELAYISGEQVKYELLSDGSILLSFMLSMSGDGVPPMCYLPGGTSVSCQISFNGEGFEVVDPLCFVRELTEEPDPNAELLAYFQNLLKWNNGTTPYNGAISCIFDSPEDIDLSCVFYDVGYFTDGGEWQDFTEEEKAYLIAEGAKKNLGFGEIPAQKRTARQLEQALQDYFGVTLSDVRIPDEWVYYAATDSYYSCHGDVRPVQDFTVTKVEQGEGGLIYVYYTTFGPLDPYDTYGDGYDMVLTLQIQASRLNNPHGYAVVANQTLSDFEAFTTAAEKAVDPAQISVRAKTPYQAAGNYVEAWGKAYTAQMPYFIRDYRLIDWGVEQISADGKAVSGWLYCSILPTREYDAEGGIQFSAGNAGYLYGSFTFVLEEQDGIWMVAGWDKLGGISLEDCGYTPMEGIEATVTGFLNEYLTELYCCTNGRWLDYTTGGIHIYEVDELSEADQAIVWEAERNISYLDDKATYWKLSRREQGISRTEFSISYSDMKIKQSGNRATVNVDAWMSFVYEGETERSGLQEPHEIQLVKINGVWLITDVMQEVFWFDYDYKDNREALDKEIEYLESQYTSRIQMYDMNGDGMIQSTEFPYAEGEAFGLTGEYATLYTAVAEYVMRGSGNVLGGRDLTLPRIARVYGKYEDKDGNMNYICGMNTMYYYGLGAAPGQWPANHTGVAVDFVLATLDSDGNLVGFKTWPDSPGIELAQKLYREYCGPLEDLAEAFINGTEDNYAEELMTEYKNEGPRLAQYLSYYFGE